MTDYLKKTALIIEDFAEFARSLKAMLNEIGIVQVDLVNSGESAIRACDEKLYDIILSDYNLGHGKNGMQVLEELHFNKRVRSDAVFIMTTAENTTAMVMGALENQPDSYLTKPFNSASLRSRLSKLIQKKEALSKLYQLIDKGQLNKALELTEQLKESYPKYKMTILKLESDCLVRKNKFSEAANLFQSVIDDRPIPWAMIGLAKCCLAKREYDQAETVLKDTIQNFPMILEADDLFAQCQLKLGQKQEAQDTLESAVAKSPNVIKRQTQLGEIASENEQFDRALKAFKQTIRLGNNSVFKSPDSYLNYSNTVSKKVTQSDESTNKTVIFEAEEFLKDFYKEYKDDRVCKLRGTVAEGNLLRVQGRQEEAQLCMKSAQKQYQNIDTMLSSKSGFELAIGMKNLGDEETAEAILKDTVEHNFEDSEFLEKALPFLKDHSVLEQGKKAHKLNSQGIRFFEQKEFSKAIECFYAAIDTAPKNVSIILNTVQVLLKMHQSGQADDSIVDKCLSFLTRINNMSHEDHRYHRFQELFRLARSLQLPDTF